MTTAEMMAVKVLQGDLAAARVLADHLLEDSRDPVEGQLIDLPPMNKFACDAEQIRGIVYVDVDTNIGRDGREAMENAFRRWVRGHERIMVTRGVNRIDLYQFPPRDKTSDIDVRERSGIVHGST